MAIHILKIKKQYADEISAGNKMFEVRLNDRNYQKGDLVQFMVTDCDELHDIDKNMFQITYVLSEFPQGLRRGYVVFGIRRAEEGK